MRWFLLAVLATSACSRNLDVPAADARPVIDSFEPEQAFVGDYLYIAGRNFDPDATSNVITFANRTARAFGKDDQGRLIVQVPNGDYYDLSGNFSVTTPAGVSDPSADPFMLRGQGHIQYATPLGTTRLLHRPPGIAFVSGQLLMASQLIRAVISNEGVVAPLGDEPLGLAPNWDLTAVYAGIKGRVTRVAPGGQPLSSAEIPGQEFQLLAANDTYLFGVGKDPLGVPQVYAFDPETLAVLHHRSLDGILVEATDIGALADGRVALSGKA
ncbi:MAG: IPT/TIG domain-containing protein, partial [Deltaproteobacteria bacterium]|nr:IPT/TIG domain-containing protein [Deltaproteobacteria bacterium]